MILKCLCYLTKHINIDTRTSETRPGSAEEIAVSIPTTYTVDLSGNAKEEGSCNVCNNCVPINGVGETKKITQTDFRASIIKNNMNGQNYFC